MTKHSLKTALAAALFSAFQVAAQPQQPSPPQDFYDVLRANNIDTALADGVKHKNIQVIIPPLSPYPFENESFNINDPTGPGDVCQIQVANPALTRTDMIYKYTSIPRPYIRNFGSAADLTFARLLLHEATHCAQYTSDTSLRNETEADLYAVKALASQPDGLLNATVFRHMRAVFAVIHPTASTHAMASVLEAYEKGLPPPDPDRVQAAQIMIHNRLVAEGIFEDYEHWIDYQQGEDRVRRIYGLLNRWLSDTTFDQDPEGRKIAELFIEAVDYLAPGMMSTPAPLQPATAPRSPSP